jgi:hypothetical protein
MTEDSGKPKSRSLDQVVFSSEGVGLANASLSYWTPRAQVHRLLVRFGPSSAHPILQAALGVVLVVLGLVPLRHVIDWLRFGGHIWRFEVLAFALIPLGIWLSLGAFRRSYHLVVQGASGDRRLALHPRTSRKHLEEFIQEIEGLGYSFEWETDHGR